MLKFLRTQWRATRRNGARLLLLYVCDDFALDRAVDFELRDVKHYSV